MAAALQQLDLDVVPEHWSPPNFLIDLSLLAGIPPHGIGRPCKVGKEAIIGLLTALGLFLAEKDAARHARWLATAHLIADGLKTVPQATVGAIGGEADQETVPVNRGESKTRLKTFGQRAYFEPAKWPTVDLRQCKQAGPQCRRFQPNLPESGRGQGRRRPGGRSAVWNCLAGSLE